MALEQYTNNAATTLNGAINNSVTSLVVTSATGFPTVPNFRIIVENEIMLVTAVSGTTYTVTRGVEGTTAASHADLTVVTHVLTAASLFKLIEESNMYDTYANLPAAGRKGRRYKASNSPLWYLDNGSTWDAFIEGVGPLNPNLADFTTWVNQDSSVIDTTLGYQKLSRVNGAGGENLHCRVKSTGGLTTWAMTLLLKVNSPPGSSQNMGICLRDSASGKIMTWSLNASTNENVNVSGYNFSSATAFNSSIFAGDAWCFMPDLKGMRLRADGTNFYFDYSVDGYSWTEHRRTAISGSYITSSYDQIGFFFDISTTNNANQTSEMHVYHAVFG